LTTARVATPALGAAVGVSRVRASSPEGADLIVLP